MIQQSPDFRIEGIRSVLCRTPHKREKMLSAFGNIDWSAVTYTTRNESSRANRSLYVQQVSVEARWLSDLPVECCKNRPKGGAAPGVPERKSGNLSTKF